MSNPIGSIGTRQDLLIRQGADFALAGIVTAASQPVDLTGGTVRGQIRKTPFAVDVAATFAVTLLDQADPATRGHYRVELSNAVTQAIPCGIDISKPESVYQYDLEFLDSQGRVHPLSYGTVLVHREITRG